MENATIKSQIGNVTGKVTETDTVYTDDGKVKTVQTR